MFSIYNVLDEVAERLGLELLILITIYNMITVQNLDLLKKASADWKTLEEVIETAEILVGIQEKRDETIVNITRLFGIATDWVSSGKYDDLLDDTFWLLNKVKEDLWNLNQNN